MKLNRSKRKRTASKLSRAKQIYVKPYQNPLLVSLSKRLLQGSTQILISIAPDDLSEAAAYIQLFRSSPQHNPSWNQYRHLSIQSEANFALHA